VSTISLIFSERSKELAEKSEADFFRDPQDARSLLLLALCRLKLGELDAAEQAARSAAAVNDSGGSALTILAQVLQALGRPEAEEAVRECPEALHRDPTYAAAAVSGPRSAIACGDQESVAFFRRAATQLGPRVFTEFTENAELFDLNPRERCL
jgi:tetratricopeptide (TPR) repeat protein